MHIVLISACEKRALKRTRAVLDSYALRTSDRSWATPITLEALQELHAALRRTASRHTAVACYRNDGLRRLKLLWIVGHAQAFGPHGHYPAGFTRIARRPPVATWVRHAALLAAAAGRAHDIGKASRAFQAKLRHPAAPQKDALRHEWVSLKVLQSLRRGDAWETAWRGLAHQTHRQAVPFTGDGPTDAHAALDFLVVSHHGLFGPRTGAGALSNDRHVRSDVPFTLADYQPHAALSDLTLAVLDKNHQRLARLTPPEGIAPRPYWRAVTLLARAGLILADHHISAQLKPGAADLYANTHHGALNQPLDAHLADVAQAAGRLTYRLATLRLPGLTPLSRERLLEPAADPGPFVWQNRAVAALTQLRLTDDRPALVLNLAGTGAGKTRMNAQCAGVLAGDRPVRFATVLNLRTLTRQTGTAYREQLSLDGDELACIMGDRTALRLHAPTGKAEPLVDVDENPPEATFTALDAERLLPDWLEPLVRQKPLLRPLLSAPVLVATVDFLIAAGEPHRQGHHALALVRLADSDLILDEIDSYDPKALVAVLRLVHIAALLGRTVIAASATLPLPVARGLSHAYHSGSVLRAARDGRPDPGFLGIFLDDRLAPDGFACTGPEDFAARYAARIQRLLPTLGQPWRLPCLARVAEPTLAAWHAAIAASVTALHEANAWRFTATGQRLSFGLVRIANIRPAVETARFLATTFPHAHVACYHAQDLALQRALKEQQLDRLLTRKVGAGAIDADPDVRQRAQRTAAADVLFIVVATPVEEIGRDHDFDWAVIEPSSSHSLVQTAGRVNRHRRIARTRPNVAILQINHRQVRGHRIVFQWPGLETADRPYNGPPHDPRYHDLEHLLDWARLPVLDAGLRFSDHPLARLDDENLSAELESPLRQLAQDHKPRAWMTEALYADYPLRERSPQATWRLNDDDQFEVWLVDRGREQFVVREDLVTRQRPVANAWLTWTLEELMDEALERGLTRTEALELTLPLYGEALEPFEWDPAFGASRPFRR